MKKLSIRKKILALLISSNIMLTGCSISDKMTSKKEQNSVNTSYTQSSIDENTSKNESKLEDSSNIESSLDKQESIESKEESIEFVESSLDESEDIIESSIEENSIEEISELESVIEEESSEESKEENSVEEISELESVIEEESSEESKEENSVEETSILESSIEEESKFEESSKESSEESKEEYDDSNEVYTDDESYIRAKTYVNIRKEPNTNCEILDLLNEGDKLKKLGFVNDFYIVEYNGKKAYVSMEYTEEIQKLEKKSDLNIINICYFPSGSVLYSDKELVNKIKDIPSLESGEIYYQDNNTYYVETDGDKGYVSKKSASIISQPVVVVDESDQISILFKNNKKILEFPVVTGDINTPTSKGLFEIYYVSYDKTLTGPTWEVGVGVFMPFTIWSEGFHDAWWRSDSEFGGNTYQGNGSHGCVNCRYDDVMALAHEVEDSMYNDNKECKVLVKR